MSFKPLEIFEQISQIPHPSFHTQDLFAYLCRFASDCGYEVLSDNAKNIRAFKSSKPRLCFQSHYDMVAVGEAYKPLKLYQKDGMLRAKDSSLGADNGIGVALGLYLMQKYDDLEFLFTNNEEVGLLGAKSLELNIASDTIINLDSETFGEIILGCAGGYDMNISFELPKDSTPYAHTYAITSKGFKGGHSGIDIDKPIKNAIVSLVGFIQPLKGAISSFQAGEKINSIPVNAQVVFKTDEVLESSEDFIVSVLEEKDKAFKDVFYQKEKLCSFVLGAKNGVRAKDGKDVIDSLNLSMIKQDNSLMKIFLMGRANNHPMLEKGISDIKTLSHQIDPNALVTIEDFYPPWERNIPDDDPFLMVVKNAFGSELKQVSQIHAGLECGILQDRLEKMGKKNLKILSIGPTIISPHSVYEALDIEIFEKFFLVLESLAEKYKI